MPMSNPLFQYQDCTKTLAGGSGKGTNNMLEKNILMTLRDEVFKGS
ncbi:MAG: hypothetical protein CM15mP22_6820 [Gammaproteobacteria bacterium]|nr:MAG: hypothetical protein CM15mP22_6820 [Gammaproteobacteria bacterium]